MDNVENLANSLRILGEKGNRIVRSGHWYPDDDPDNPKNIEMETRKKYMEKAETLCSYFPNHTTAELSNIVRVVAKICTRG
jgi:hypothetical protein